MPDLVRLLRQHPASRGLTVVDDRVDPAPGSFTPVGTMSHHTAGSSLHVQGLQEGYSFPGPLCNVAIDVDGSVHVITDGRANDSGNGSGKVLEEVRRDVAPSGDARARGLSDTTSGNPWFYDVEVVNDGAGQTYPDVQLGAHIRVLAAIHDHHGWPAARAIHHREWTRRKVDMSWRGDLRGRLAAQVGTAGTVTPAPAPDQEDDLMAMDPKERKELLRDMALAVHGGEAFGGVDLPLSPSDSKLPPWRFEHLARAALAVDLDDLAERIVARMPEGADARAIARATVDELHAALG